MKAWTRGEQVWNASMTSGVGWLSFIHVYSLGILFGVLCSVLAIIYFWRRQKYPMEIFQVMVIIIVPTSVIGARFWFVLWEGGWDRFFEFRGLSIHGGVFFSALAASIYGYSKRHIIDYKTAFSMILPNVILGQMIGRWGNFANHEVYGAITSSESLDWMGALKSHMYITDAMGTFYRQPLFLYEFITSGSGWIFMVWILLFKNWPKPGVIGAIYILWYGIVRIAMEPVRAEVDQMGAARGFPVSIFVAGLSIAAGLYLIIYWQWLCVPLKYYFAKKYLNFLTSTQTGVDRDKFRWRAKDYMYRILTKLFNTKEYDRITPVKPRRKYWLVGAWRENKRVLVWNPPRKYVLAGPKYTNAVVAHAHATRYLGLFSVASVPNRVILWVPKEPVEKIKWSKREIKRGKRDPEREMAARLAKQHE